MFPFLIILFCYHVLFSNFISLVKNGAFKLKQDFLLVHCNVCNKVCHYFFLQEHFQVCPKYPQACEKCGQENIPRDMVNHTSVASNVLLSLRNM